MGGSCEYVQSQASLVSMVGYAKGFVTEAVGLTVEHRLSLIVFIVNRVINYFGKIFDIVRFLDKALNSHLF